MKANELMIGDFVTFKDCQNDEVKPIVKIWQLNEDNEAFVSIDSNDALEEIEIDDEIIGIPLTSEILEKNGFTYYESNGSFALPTNMSYGNWDVDVVLFNVTHEHSNNQLHIATPDDSITLLHLMECNHVHDLQHALRLCGIDKEITL